jgi:hypothetical protein
MHGEHDLEDMQRQRSARPVRLADCDRTRHVGCAQ